MTLNRLGAACAIAALAAAPPPASAQGAKPGPSSRIQFRAIGDDGQFVSDLKPGELTLKVNGKPRTIQSLNLFRATADTAANAVPLPPPYSTNVATEHGRVYHVLIDDDSISAGREIQVKESITALTAELSPNDRIGVLNTQGTINIAPGSDAAKVRAAVTAFNGRAGTTETDTDAKCRTKRVLAAVGTMLSLARDTPTTILVFSSGMSTPERKVVMVGSRTDAGTSDLCPVEPDDFSNIGNLAAVSSADMYVFQLVDGLITRTNVLDAGVESLAGVTGAEFVRMPTSPQAAMSRVLRETSAYYIATFEPDPGDRAGQALRVELKATRDKVKVRTPAALQLGKTAAAAKGTPTPRDMLRVAGEYRDLPLRATSYASRMAPGSEDVKVVALFENPDAATFSSASVGLFDDKGTLKKQWTANKDDLSKPLVRADLVAPAGLYRVRVAAVDASGRAGTTDYDLRAETVRADPLKLSALVIGTQPQGGGFAPRLEFKNEAVAIGLLEIYGVPPGADVKVDLDVATVSEGTPLATAETQVGKGTAEDARMAIGGFSIDSLPPGDYLMRAVVSLNGKPVGRVTRTLRKAK